MITFFLNQLHAFLSFLIGLFPAGTGFPTAFHTAVQALNGYLYMLDPIVPIDTLLTCLTIIFGVELALFGFRTLKWLLSYIPFIGGSSGN